MACNAHNHVDCDCGWGGVSYGTPEWGLPAVGTSASADPGDFCRPARCPKCSASVYFVRHNGGSVWFDELGWPWPKHPCMDDSVDDFFDDNWLQKMLTHPVWVRDRRTFGVIESATVVVPGRVTKLAVRCYDKQVVSGTYACGLDPDKAVGRLAVVQGKPGFRPEALWHLHQLLPHFGSGSPLVEYVVSGKDKPGWDRPYWMTVPWKPWVDFTRFSLDGWFKVEKQIDRRWALTSGNPKNTARIVCLCYQSAMLAAELVANLRWYGETRKDAWVAPLLERWTKLLPDVIRLDARRPTYLPPSS